MKEQRAKLWTADGKQIYEMNDNNKIYQKRVKLDGYNNEYIYMSNGREENGNNGYVYEGANWRAWDAKDGRVIRVQNQEVILAAPDEPVDPDTPDEPEPKEK